MARTAWRDRIVEVRTLKAADLMANPRNFRTHSKAQSAALTGVLDEVGKAAVLVAYTDSTGRLTLIDGHLRKDADPDEEWRVAILDVDEAEADKLLLTMDPIAAMAGADSTLLQALLDGVRTDSAGLDSMLRDMAEDAGVLYGTSGEPVQDVEPEIDRAEELRQQYGVELGQLWVLGNHRLLCGDSTDKETVGRVMGGAAFRVMWTDPPYGVSYADKNRFLNAMSRGNRIQEPIENDHMTEEQTEALLRAAFTLAYPHGTAGAACYVAAPPGPLHRRFIDAMDGSGFIYKHQLIWVKQQFVLGRSDYHYRHEPVLYGWKDDGAHYFVDDHTHDSVFEVDKPHVSDMHPTTKPVDLVRPMIENSSRPGEIVYEPFSGSGTTILACEQSGRSCRAIELDPGYVAVALHRWETATDKTAERIDG